MPLNVVTFGSNITRSAFLFSSVRFYLKAVHGVLLEKNNQRCQEKLLKNKLKSYRARFKPASDI